MNVSDFAWHTEGYRKIPVICYSCLSALTHAFVSVCNAASQSFTLANELLFFRYQLKCSVSGTHFLPLILDQDSVTSSPSTLHVLSSTYHNND